SRLLRRGAAQSTREIMRSFRHPGKRISRDGGMSSRAWRFQFWRRLASVPVSGRGLDTSGFGRYSSNGLGLPRFVGCMAVLVLCATLAVPAFSSDGHGRLHSWSMERGSLVPNWSFEEELAVWSDSSAGGMT